MVEKTILVPTVETVTRTIHVTEYTNESRERTVTVMQRVPKTETVTSNYTVIVPKTETKTITYNACKPVVKEETQEYTVCVPRTETREGTHKVRKCVPTTKTRMVTVDEGHWEQAAPATSATGCGECGATAGCGAQSSCCDSGCGRSRLFGRRCGGSPCGNGNGCDTAVAGRTWVSKPVQKEVTYTAYQTVWEDRQYSWSQTVMKPETRTRTVQKTSYETEPRVREVTYTRCVPEQRSRTQEVTRYECVPTQKTVVCTVRVPHQVEKQIQVQVCKMVPKTVLVPASSDDGCGSSDCGGRSWGRGRRCRGC